jgi:hypothetical protein
VFVEKDVLLWLIENIPYRNTWLHSMLILEAAIGGNITLRAGAETKHILTLRIYITSDNAILHIIKRKGTFELIHMIHPTHKNEWCYNLVRSRLWLEDLISCYNALRDDFAYYYEQHYRVNPLYQLIYY